MRYRVVIFIWLLGFLYSHNALCQINSIDSFLLVSYDANYKYMQNFDGTPYVEFLKKLLDDKEYWNESVDSNDNEDTKIKYRCVVTKRKLLNRFERLLSKCDTSSYIDLSNFFNMSTRIGLKVYKGNQIEYMFIEPKASDYFDKFIITETTERRASNALIRFLKKMKRKQRCNRCP